MENINPDSFSEQFSEDPQENLRIENEILHLTIKAELGGELMQYNQLPPEVENEFLKNVLAFEHAFADSKQIKVFDLLNKPAFTKAAELDDNDLPPALENLIALLKEKDIVVQYMADYEDRLKYTFITEELFEHEMNHVEIPGMVSYFCYEDFHPDHKMNIGERASEFIVNWVEHNIDDYRWSLGETFILPDGRTLSKEEVLVKIQRMFDAYPIFSDHSYDLSDIHFEFGGESGTGMGYAAGKIRYTAILESGEKIKVSGPFKFCLLSEGGYWSITYFVFPGFDWS